MSFKNEEITLQMMRDLSLTSGGQKHLKRYCSDWEKELEEREKEFQDETSTLRHWISEVKALVGNSVPKPRRRGRRKSQGEVNEEVKAEEVQGEENST